MASPRRLIPLVLTAWCLAYPAMAGAAEGRVAALESLRVEERVDGDVVVLGGDVVVGREAHVTGHVVAVFGTVRMEEGARVDGRVCLVPGTVPGDRVRLRVVREREQGARRERETAAGRASHGILRGSESASTAAQHSPRSAPSHRGGCGDGPAAPMLAPDARIAPRNQGGT